MAFHTHLDELTSELNKRFFDYNQCQHMAFIISEELREDKAWVEIEPQEFHRRVGPYFTEGYHEYVRDTGLFKSVELKNGGQKFFIQLYSNTEMPIKGWMKRVMYKLRKQFPLDLQDGNHIFAAVNKQIATIKTSA